MLFEDDFGSFFLKLFKIVPCVLVGGGRGKFNGMEIEGASVQDKQRATIL